jgi:lipoprotein-anchoring transpeptidase ErfK/SrfK
MNSLKTLFIVAVLGAVAYGVYVSINRNPETPETTDVAPVWPEAPQVQMPGPGAAMPQYPPPAGAAADMAPPFSSGPTGTRPGGPLAADAPTTAGGSAAAPPYASLGNTTPPTSAPSNGGSPLYPSSGDIGTSDNVASASAALGAASRQGPPGYGDTQGPGANSLRGPQGPPSDPLPGRPAQNVAEEKYMAFLQAVQMKLDEGRLDEALSALSSLYDNPNLPPDQAREITDLLDQLAGTVIYSRQHLLEQPYKVRPGETLEQIAEAYKVPPQLLAKINGIRDRQPLEPGRELKVVRGPFNALIDLDKYELTLMLGGRYAGRFAIGVGRDQPNLAGSYVVRNKIVNPGRDGRYASPGAGDADNGYPGGYWIDLGNQIGIHGTNDPQNLHRTGGRGSVCLGDRDIEDVFGILSVGSRVIIQR